MLIRSRRGAKSHVDYTKFKELCSFYFAKDTKHDLTDLAQSRLLFY